MENNTNISKKDIETLSSNIFKATQGVSIAINSTLSVIDGVSKSVEVLNTTIEHYSRSTEKLSRNTFWLNVVITVSAFIGAIKVGFDIFIHFSTK